MSPTWHLLYPLLSTVSKMSFVALKQALCPQFPCYRNTLVKYLWCFWPNLFSLLWKLKALWGWHRSFPLALDVKASPSDPWRCLVCRGSQGCRPGEAEPGLFSLFATFDSRIGYSALTNFDKRVWPSSSMIFLVVVLISAPSFGKERQWGWKNHCFCVSVFQKYSSDPQCWVTHLGTGKWLSHAYIVVEQLYSKKI